MGLLIILSLIIIGFILVNWLLICRNNYKYTKRIAFLFLIVSDVKQPLIWKNFFKGHADKFNIYVHPKYPNKIKSFFKDHIIQNLVPTEWGDLSLVVATNNLIREALDNPFNQKFILVSDSCVPIKTFKYVYKTVLQDNTSWFNYYSPQPTPRPGWLGDTKTHYEKINLLQPWLRANAFIQEQWMILDRRHAELIDRNNHLLKYFTIDGLFPDEMYYITILHTLIKKPKGHFKFRRHSRKTYKKHKYITQAKWTKGRPSLHPKEFGLLTKDDIRWLKTSPALFARKFTESSDIGDHWHTIVKTPASL
jgi:hypothetical protein